jgi:hypothetical protein
MPLNDDEAGLRGQFEESGYVVLARPQPIPDSTEVASLYQETSDIFELNVIRSWKLAAPTTLTVAYAQPDGVFYSARGLFRPDEKRIFFLRNGQAELTNRSCDLRVFTPTPEAIALLDGLGKKYRDALKSLPPETGGLVCLSPTKPSDLDASIMSPYSVKVDGSEPVTRSFHTPVFVSRLYKDTEHMVEIIKSNRRVASFRFRFEDGQSVLCLRGSEAVWRLDEGNCGCLRSQDQ